MGETQFSNEGKIRQTNDFNILRAIHSKASKKWINPKPGNKKLDLRSTVNLQL
jgi:hypothetical protein